jgi:hypothetical protein
MQVFFIDQLNESIFEVDSGTDAVNIESWEMWKVGNDPFEECSSAGAVNITNRFRGYQDWFDYAADPPDLDVLLGYVVTEGQFSTIQPAYNGISVYLGNIPNDSAYCFIVRITVSDSASIGIQNVDADTFPGDDFPGNQDCHAVYFGLDGTPVLPAEPCTPTEVINIEAPVEPWIQTSVGDVGALGDIEMDRDPDNPAISGDNADYLVLANGANPHFSSAKDWLVSPYAVDLHGLDSYDNLWEEYRTRSEGTADFPTPYLTRGRIESVVESDGGVMVWGDNMSVIDEDGGAPFQFDYFCYSCNPTVIFVEGNMNIEVPIHTGVGTGLVFIVRGNITVDPIVDRLDGFYIADESFDSGDSGTQLTVNGGVIAFGPELGDPFVLDRDLGDSNASTPSEKFIYEPKYLWLFRQQLGTSESTFEEVGP